MKKYCIKEVTAYLLPRFCLGLIVFCSACATTGMSEEECRQADWYRIGKNDGNQGRLSKRFVDYSQQCSQRDLHADEKQYAAGYLEGQAYYCTYETGYRHASIARRPSRSCPENSNYIFGYLEGREALRHLRVGAAKEN